MNITKIDTISSLLKASIPNLISINKSSNNYLAIQTSTGYQLLPCPPSEKVTITMDPPLVARIIKDI